MLLGLAQGGSGGLASAAGALAGIGLVTGALALACTLLGGRLLSAASVAEENDAGGRIEAAADADPIRLWRRVFSAPVAAMILKDLKYLGRDSVLKSQLSMPLILFLVPFLVVGPDFPRMGGELAPFAAIMIGVIVFMQTSILSLSSIGLESRSFWIVMASPNPAGAMLWAKFLMSTLVSGGIGALLTLAAGAILGTPLLVMAVQMGMVVLCAAALCGLGVGISAALPRFVYGNPAHRVSAWALILGFFASIGYLMASTLVLGLATILASRPEAQESAATIYGIGALVYLALTAYAIYLPMAIGARRLDRYQWEH